jgi:iron complex outermembrane receptor protein
VTDENEETLIGVSILVVGTTSGTVTDIDGRYSVNVPAGAEKLLFSYTGFASKKVSVSGATATSTSYSKKASTTSTRWS